MELSVVPTAFAALMVLLAGCGGCHDLGQDATSGFPKTGELYDCRFTWDSGPAQDCDLPLLHVDGSTWSYDGQTGTVTRTRVGAAHDETENWTFAGSGDGPMAWGAASFSYGILLRFDDGERSMQWRLVDDRSLLPIAGWYDCTTAAGAECGDGHMHLHASGEWDLSGRGAGFLAWNGEQLRFEDSGGACIPAPTDGPSTWGDATLDGDTLTFEGGPPERTWTKDTTTDQAGIQAARVASVGARAQFAPRPIVQVDGSSFACTSL